MSAFAKHRCTFCGAHSDDVGKLFVGPNHQAICDRCVTVCVAHLNGEPAYDDIPGRLAKWRRETPVVFRVPAGMRILPPDYLTFQPDYAVAGTDGGLWRRAALPAATPHSDAKTSSDRLEGADELLCVCHGGGADPLHLGGLCGICLAEKVGPAEFGDDSILDELHVSPSLSVVWPGYHSPHENTDHVSKRHLLSKFLVEPLSKSGGCLVGHVGSSVRMIRAWLIGRGRVAADRARHSSADEHAGNGGAA